MASTNKTPQLGLNQWAAGDEVMRADFNGDNAKIDAAIEANAVAAAAAALAAADAVVKMKSGYVISSGAEIQDFDMGFAPRLVILNTSPSGGCTVILDKNCLFKLQGSNMTMDALDITNASNQQNAPFQLTATGFRSLPKCFFSAGQSCYYIAFG